MFNKLKKFLKSKRAVGSVAAAIKVGTACVLGAAVLVGGVALTNDIVLPNTSDKVNNVAEYEGDSAGDAGGVSSVIPLSAPTMLEGEGQVLNASEPDVFSFRSSAPIDTFVGVKVDDEIVDGAYYTVTEGSTIVTFTKQYSNSLSTGSHYIEIISDDGYGEKSATANFSKANYYQEGFDTLTEGKEIPSYFYYGDYKYTRNGSEGSYSWQVALNTSYDGADEPYTFGLNVTHTDKNQVSYGEILEEAFGYPIIDISYTFWNCTSLTVSPLIPNNVTNIASAFQNCTSLTTAPMLPNSITKMNGTFLGCLSLKTYIGSTDADGDFSHYLIPNGTTTIPNLFKNCTLISAAPEIPDTVTAMYDAFRGCTSLIIAPTIPSSVTDMTFAFDGCSSLTGNIEINATLTKRINYQCCLRNTLISSVSGTTTITLEELKRDYGDTIFVF